MVKCQLDPILINNNLLSIHVTAIERVGQRIWVVWVHLISCEAPPAKVWLPDTVTLLTASILLKPLWNQPTIEYPSKTCQCAMKLRNPTQSRSSYVVLACCNIEGPSIQEDNVLTSVTCPMMIRAVLESMLGDKKCEREFEHTWTRVINASPFPEWQVKTCQWLQSAGNVGWTSSQPRGWIK